MTIWILTGITAINTLTILFFIIQKFLSSKRNSGMVQHDENGNEVLPSNTPVAYFNNKGGTAEEEIYADEEIYDDIELHNM